LANAVIAARAAKSRAAFLQQRGCAARSAYISPNLTHIRGGFCQWYLLVSPGINTQLSQARAAYGLTAPTPPTPKNIIDTLLEKFGPQKVE